MRFRAKKILCQLDTKCNAFVKLPPMFMLGGNQSEAALT